MKSIWIATLTLPALLLYGCSGGKSENTEDEKKVSQKTAEALEEFVDKAGESTDKDAVDPVDFRALRKLLPEKLEGFERTEATGEKSGALGFTISTAIGKYEGPGDASIHIKILDTGGIAGITTMSLAAWSMAEIDKETASGYEKTTTIDGYKAFEKYDNASRSGEFSVLVGDRYIVNIEGSDVSDGQLKETLKSINLSHLKGLK